MTNTIRGSQLLGSQALCLAISLAPMVTTAETSNCSESSTSGEACSQQESSNQIELIEVYGVPSAPYQADRSGDLRRLMKLSETPQTLNILTQQQILDSGKSDLKEIVSAQAGVTLGTGENGNAFGDRYIIRGHEARSDVFVDGLRDPGMTTRESFASEQVEITKGPSATFAGRGSSGGAINSITKQASPDANFNRLDTSMGTDDYYRLVLDVNAPISDNSAVRFNLLQADETIPDREGIEKLRQGALVSGFYAATEALSFIGDVYYLNAEDTPDLGSFFDRELRKPYKDIPVYAQNEDFLNTEVSAVTLRTNFQLNETVRLYNATRWGTTDNGYVTTGARGTTRDASDPFAPGADTISLSTHQGWQKVDYWATQFNLFWDSELFGHESRWVFGVEYTDEAVDNGVYNIGYNGTSNCLVSGRGGVQAGYCALDGNGAVIDDLSSLMQRTIERGSPDAQSAIQTTSLYAMNTLDLTDKLNLFLGLRQDSFDYSNDVVSRGVPASYDYSDDLINGHVGLVYDITDEGNVYLTYSTATNINGGESDVGGSCGYGGLCGDPDQVQASDPERVENIELGTKWELFDDRLLATAALFRITKSDVMESVGDDYAALGTLNTGENRVKGVELSLSGAITDQLSVQFSATKMDAEVLESVNEENIGLALSNFAEESLYLMLRYQPSASFAFGASATYQGEMYGGQPDTAAGYDATIGDYSIVVPDYTVYDLFFNYYHSDTVNLRVNVGNVTDREYWTAAYRSGSFMYLGNARNVRATVTWQF
ncbi:TonB-dependent receptor [Halioxenophilus sp. WMMB6]|uniref:TonB-dependent receptor n=1 Tax=Halioxenophilus sp. WMMB6 TaxID=3073815 RepID=UPI00295E669A|nr:TonB-dependent receptor [Halioxenophilus sp. WMMB6]